MAAVELTKLLPAAVVIVPFTDMVAPVDDIVNPTIAFVPFKANVDPVTINALLAYNVTPGVEPL